MQYRREIDGLRAVAVLPVILFHAGFSVFSGGYVGVDVFFVISGYLITSILIGELEQENFSILRFYERRARRILPALFVVILACLPFAYMWMLPTQLEDFAQSLVAVVFFGSNILFWRESGYFDAAAELKPLLHTWSLAVEEQYYLIFPILLLLVWHFGRNKVFWSVVVMAAISLLLAEWGWRNKPSANFYLAPTRAWELLAGSICAFLTVGRTLKSSNVWSAIGLAAIVFAIFVFDENTPFPSVYALLPVVGTALIILFGRQGTWVANLLSMRAFVGIGLISYSAYLWHQPLFAFARLRSLTEPSHVLMGTLAIGALLLAWGTWRWVEQPFRKRASPVLVTRRSVFVACGTVGAVFVALGLAGHFGRGFEWRFSDDILEVVRAEGDRASRECNFDGNRQVAEHPQQNCTSAADQGIDVMLIGDSHMWALTDGMRSALEEVNIGYYHVSHTSCLPLIGFKVFTSARVTDCQNFLAEAINWAKDNEVTTIVLAARFPLYLKGVRYDNGDGGVEAGNPAWVDLADREHSDWNDSERRERVLAAYEKRISELALQFNVVLVYPIPEAGWNVPVNLFKKHYFDGGKATLSTSYVAYRERAREVNGLFDRLVAEFPSIYGAPVHEALCSEISGRCVNADTSGVYYYDDDHLSNAGARLVAPIIVEAIEATLGR